MYCQNSSDRAFYDLNLFTEKVYENIYGASVALPDLLNKNTGLNNLSLKFR